MKRLIILITAVSSMLMAQDAVGQYKLSGVDVLYTFIARGDATLTVTDPYGFGVTVPVAEIPGGAPFSTQAMQLTDAALSALGINLNVTLNDDGSGAIAEGSYYPDVNTIEDEDGNCVTLQQVLPVTDEFTYSSMQNGMDEAGFAHPGVNVMGLPGISQKAGQQIGLFGLSGSNTFEDYPMVPEHPTLCGPDGSCFPFTVGDIDGSGTLEIYPDVNLLGIPEYVPGGAPLTGLTGGYFVDADCEDGSPCNSDGIESVYPGNTAPDMHLEWHGIDGASSGLGYSELEEEDEDGDGTWFDRELGIPGITATYINPACGFNQPVYGDVTEVFTAMGLGDCIDNVGSAASGYLMDESLVAWGGFLTAHGALYQQCLSYEAYGILPAGTCNTIGGGVLLTDDSNIDVDPSCLADYTPGNFEALLDCAGRLTMNFDIPCVPIIEAREVVAEFISVGGGACGTGDMNLDGGLNVLDVVALVNTVLNGGGRTSDVGATSAKFHVSDNEVTMTADGYVTAVQMTLSHGNDFTLELTEDALVADYVTDGTTTNLMVVNPGSNSLFTANDAFIVETIIAASNSQDYMHTEISYNDEKPASIESLLTYKIGKAYPNPFNTTAYMTLELDITTDVSVKVFNTMGQLVDVISEGQLSAGSYTFEWNGANASSGVYLLQTQIGSVVENQKIMLLK